MSLRKKRRQTVGRQGILPFVIELGERREDVTSYTGLPLVVEAFRSLGLDNITEKYLPTPQRERDYTQSDKVEALTTLIAAGGERIQDVKILSEDKGLEVLLDQPFPSPDTLLDFLNLFHDPKYLEGKLEAQKAFIPPESSALQGLHQINRTLIQRAADPTITVATIDHDGTIIESHKRDAKVAYEGTRGYQPLVAVWAEQQLIVADEFRDGNVPGGQDPLTSVKRAFSGLPDSVKDRYFRGDSADYYAPLLKYLVKEKIGFTISADMTQDLRAVCVGLNADQWREFENRAHEKVDWAEVEFTPGTWQKDADPLRYIALRFTPLQTDLFEVQGVKYLAIVSNRKEIGASELIQWHWEKAGTIEHVHRVMKDELGAGVMPSQLYGANAAWFRINGITYNLLSYLKRRILPERYKQARPKRLRFEVFVIPSRLNHSQDCLTAKISASNERLQEIVEARQKLLQARDSFHDK